MTSLQRFSYRLISLGYRLRKIAARFFGRKAERWAATLHVWIIYLPHRALRLRKMQRALGLPPEACRKIERRHIEFLIKSEIQFEKWHHATPAEIRDTIGLEGEEHLKAALDGGKGAVLVGAHLGNFSFARMLLAARGYRNVRIKMRFPVAYLEELEEKMLAHFGIRNAIVGQGASALVEEALAQNEVVGCSCDIVLRKVTPITTTFGSAQLMMDPGTAKLLLRLDAPILRSSCGFDREGRNVLRIGPAVERPLEKDPTLAVQILSDRLMEGIFQDIASRPEEWYGWSFVEINQGPARP